MPKTADLNVSRVVDLTAPGPRSLSPFGGVRFTGADGTVLKVHDLVFFGPDVDAHQSFAGEITLPGGLLARRAKVQVDVSRFNGRIGEVVIRSRAANPLRSIDADRWHEAAGSVLDAIYLPEPVDLAETADAVEDDDEDEAAA